MVEPAKFLPFASFIDTAFWSEVNKKKLNEWKLDESFKRVTASIGLGDTIGTECRLSFGHESFNDFGQKDDINGELVVFNTVEAFKKLNKADFLKNQGVKIWDSIITKAWLESPKLLYYFAFTAFADLKKFQYYYWLCNPAIVNYPSNITVTNTQITDPGHLRKISKDRAKNFALIYKGEIPFPLVALQDCKDSSNVKIVVPDPSPFPDAPGWPLRNFVTAVALLHPTWSSIDIISHRGTSAICFHFQWNNQPVDEPTFTGWEPNAQGKLLPRFVDLKNQFDPKRLMEQSVALNLSLIKWRLVPELKLERFEQLKVLIFGAGTLGCNLARNLLAYNVKVITFVDNSNVSYSNPVRQSLAKFEDAKEGRGKAETAAKALQEIYPSVDARWLNLTVPMPGHTVAQSEEEQLKNTVEALEDLVTSHDVIFLALDSREARWLPTVMGSKHSKMVYSVALGFDQFVVIRHGVGKAQTRKEDMEEGIPLARDCLIPSKQLGCYFCSDVTAPGNSTTDRTLDQQCTVSRPGLSPVASGIAVELLASVLQTEDPLAAPAAVGDQDENLSLLGTTPHQVRGYLFRYQQLTPAVRRFESCVACGSNVAEAYEKNGWNFVKEVLNSPSYLESVSGVAQIQQSTADLDIEFSDNDSVMSD